MRTMPPTACGCVCVADGVEVVEGRQNMMLKFVWISCPHHAAEADRHRALAVERGLQEVGLKEVIR